MICYVAGAFVVQVIVAPPSLTFETATAEMTGGAALIIAAAADMGDV